MAKDFKFELGDVVKDVVTGFEGVIRGRADYLTGCDRFAVQSLTIKENSKPEEWVWFDENEIVLAKKDKTSKSIKEHFFPKATEKPKETSSRVGGPRPSNQNPSK